MKNNFNDLKIYKKGFTLIETLVGISILLVAVIGPLYIAFQGILLPTMAKNQITATFLAQEGIEFVRFRIATNSNMGSIGKDLISTTTVYDLSNCSLQHCIIDTFSDSVFSCSIYAGGKCPYIKYNSTSKKYNYSDGEDTFFRRYIVINHNNLNDDTEFQVESKVEWGKPDDLHDVIIKEVIADWRP